MQRRTLKVLKDQNFVIIYHHLSTDFSFTDNTMKLAPEAGLKVGLNSDVIQFTGNREKNSLAPTGIQ